jgi:hypothetical protein
MLWCVVEDESTHDAQVHTVRSIWMEEAVAKAKADSLNQAAWYWKCDTCSISRPQDIHKAGDACVTRHLGGKMCAGTVSQVVPIDQFWVVPVEVNQDLQVEVQL